MNDFKICVYAIAKNEEKFVRRWAESMSEADEITVLDTGSTDNTVSLLRQYPKIRVICKEISPWRFDTARNLSLSEVSEDADYCVCTDLDEVFSQGWRQSLEEALTGEPDKVSYRYTWDIGDDGKEKTVFNIEKTHKRKGFIWTHPVHEVLSFTGEGSPKTAFAQGVRLYHYPDREKSRASYLPLLETSVEEDPEDDRNVHYLGREYMFYGRYTDAVRVLKRHLSLSTALWKDERSASMRYIAFCLEKLGDKKEAFLWLLKASAEAPYLREPWMAASEYLYREKNWHGCITFADKALEITQRQDTYITRLSCYEELPYDLKSIAYYHLGDINKALENAQRALEFSPDNSRIYANLCFFKKLTS